MTGQPIYTGDTTVMKIVAHRERAIPSLRTELPEVSEHLDAVYQKMVAKKPADRYGSMAEVIAELEKCASPPEDVPETATFEAFSLKGVAASEPTLDLDMPVISPVDEFRKARPKKARKPKLENNHIIYGSVAVGVLLILGLLGVVFSMRTPEGTLIVEVNQPDAQISVDDGKVTVQSPSDSEPVEVEVAEGKHILKITKGGFHTFAREFQIASGGEEVIRVTLVPLEKEVVGKAEPMPSSKPVALSSSGGNWALEFDGESNYVDIPSLTYDGSHPITMEAFIASRANHSQCIVSTKACSLFGYGTRWQISLFMREPDGYSNAGSGVVTQEQTPIHLAGVFDGDSLHLYLAGKRYNQLGDHDDPSGRLAKQSFGFLIGCHNTRKKDLAIRQDLWVKRVV